MCMNFVKNIGLNNLYVFGCSYSLHTNSLGDKIKSYPEYIKDMMGIENLFNYSINGNSNFFNLHNLNSKIDLIEDNSIIIFQLTHWYRISFKSTVALLNYDKNYTSPDDNIVTFIPSRKFENKFLQEWNDIWSGMLSDESYLQTLTIPSVFSVLNLIKNSKKNIKFILLSWDYVDDNFTHFFNPKLINILKYSIDNKMRYGDVLKSEDNHLTENGHFELSKLLIEHMV